MVVKFVNRMIHNNKAFILDQVLEVKGLTQFLMKRWNTGGKWTEEELRQIWTHLKGISRMVVVIVVFLLPGGAFLVPFLAQVLGQKKRPDPHRRPFPAPTPDAGTRPATGR